MRPIRRSNDDIPRYFTGKSPLELLFCTVILKNCTFSSILPSTSLRFRPPFLENEDWNNITFICSPSATCRHGNGCKPLTTTSSWSLLWHYVIVYENFRWFFVLFFFFLFVFFCDPHVNNELSTNGSSSENLYFWFFFCPYTVGAMKMYMHGADQNKLRTFVPVNLFPCCRLKNPHLSALVETNRTKYHIPIHVLLRNIIA